MKRVLLTALLGAGINLIPQHMDPCEYEDGSSQQVCVWDAKHMGDGHGQSGLIVKGGTDDARWVRLPHSFAHQLLG